MSRVVMFISGRCRRVSAVWSWPLRRNCWSWT